MRQPGDLLRAALVHRRDVLHALAPEPVAQLEDGDDRRAALARARAPDRRCDRRGRARPGSRRPSAASSARLDRTGSRAARDRTARASRRACGEKCRVPEPGDSELLHVREIDDGRLTMDEFAEVATASTLRILQHLNRAFRDSSRNMCGMALARQRPHESQSRRTQAAHVHVRARGDRFAALRRHGRDASYRISYSAQVRASEPTIAPPVGPGPTRISS